MFHRTHLTYAIFDAGHGQSARAVAERLRTRSHSVSLRKGDTLDAGRFPLTRVALQRGLVGSALLLAGVWLGTLAWAEVARPGDLFLGFGTAQATLILGIFLALAGVSAIVGGALASLPELRRAEAALSRPGRLALTVSASHGRQAFIEAELARAGALTVGSL